MNEQSGTISWLTGELLIRARIGLLGVIVCLIVGFAFLINSGAYLLQGLFVIFCMAPFCCVWTSVYAIVAYGFSHLRHWSYMPARALLGCPNIFRVYPELCAAIDRDEVRGAFGFPAKENRANHPRPS